MSAKFTTVVRSGFLAVLIGTRFFFILFPSVDSSCLSPRATRLTGFVFIEFLYVELLFNMREERIYP